MTRISERRHAPSRGCPHASGARPYTSQSRSMRHALFMLTLSAAAMLGHTDPAGAQSIPSPYEYIETSQSAGAWVGYLNTSTGRSGIGPEPAPILGTRYTIRLTGPLSGAAGIGMIPTRRTVFERVTVSADSIELDPIGEADLLLLMAEAGLRFTLTGQRTWNGLAPYAEGTLGIIGNARGRPEFEDELEPAQQVSFGPSFALGMGAGTDWFLTERFSLRAEVRNYLWRLSTPEGLTQTRTRAAEWTNNFGITFGAALHF